MSNSSFNATENIKQDFIMGMHHYLQQFAYIRNSLCKIGFFFSIVNRAINVTRFFPLKYVVLKGFG